MTEEEYFRKNYPDSCYGDKPLSPHWDFFQDGVEFGERESEEQIKRLEAQLETEKKLNAEIKARFVKCNTCTDEMKSKCLMFSENLCQGERCEELVDLMGLISKSELEKENAELKAQLESERDLPAIAYMQGAEKQKKKDEEELKKWKDEWQEQVQKATDEGYARTLQTMQLTNAKKIIKEFVEWATWQGSNCPNFKSIQDKAEQFLNEVEK